MKLVMCSRIQLLKPFYQIILILEFTNNCKMIVKDEQGQFSKRNIKKQQVTSIISDQSFSYDIIQYQPQHWTQIVPYLLVRPSRFIYNESYLLSNNAINSRFIHKEHKIPFSLSIFQPRDTQMSYIILFLHANSSSKVEGFTMLNDLPSNVGLACFDFSGCGNRYQTQYITLGIKQSEEVNIAAQYLKKLGYIVIGWGRSMGSVSLLLSNEFDILIIDSPFYSLEQLILQSAKKMFPYIFRWCLYALYPCWQAIINRQVQKLAGFHPKQLNIVQKVQKLPSNKCILFMAGINDELIGVHHSQLLFQTFKGINKQLLIFEGTHISDRKPQTLKYCFQFIEKSLGTISKDQSMEVNFSFQTTSKRLHQNQLDKQDILTKKDILTSKLLSNNLQITDKNQNTKIKCFQKTHDVESQLEQKDNNSFRVNNDPDCMKNQQFIQWQQSVVFGNSVEQCCKQQELIIPTDNERTQEQEYVNEQPKYNQNIREILEKQLKLPNLVFSEILNKTHNS